MKKKLSSLILLLLTGISAAFTQNYDFSAVAPTGQTLYYTITSSGSSPEVMVTYPGSSSSNTWNGYTKPTGSLTIPSTVTNGGTTYSVTSIGNYAFYECTSLTSVVIPNSVISIGKYVFHNCTGLTNVTIPAKDFLSCERGIRLGAVFGQRSRVDSVLKNFVPSKRRDYFFARKQSFSFRTRFDIMRRV